MLFRSKAGGSKVNDFFKHNLDDLMLYGTLLGLGLIGVWVVAALFVGRKNLQLTRKGQIVQ